MKCETLKSEQYQIARFYPNAEKQHLFFLKGILLTFHLVDQHSQKGNNFGFCPVKNIFSNTNFSYFKQSELIFLR